MTAGVSADRGSAPRAAEWAALAAAAGVALYLGGDSALWDARLQLALHLVAIGVIAGLAVAVLRGSPLPRTPVDLPVLALLAAFALATVAALNVGMSLRAMGSIVAFAAALPIALIAVRHRPGWVGLIASVPVIVLGVPGLVAMVARRIDWFLVGGPGLPPIRLPAEGSPFGSVAVPPFIIWPAWALAGLIEPSGLRRAVRATLVAIGIPFTVLSGSRSAWLAIVAAGVIVGVPWAWSQRVRWRAAAERRVGGWLVAAGGLLAVAAIVVLIAPRVTAVASLLYRVSLWRDTLAAWASDPLTGVGPGFMPIARQAAAADFTFPVRQPHSHNVPLGVLGDAGLMGLAAGLVVIAVLAWTAGPWRSRTPTGRVAATVLLGLGIGSLFEDLTFNPNFGLLAILLAAVALTGAGAVRWRPIVAPTRIRLAATVAAAGAAVALVVAMVIADAGAIAYRSGMDAVVSGRWGAATSWFAHSAELDPWHASAPKALAIAAERAGEHEVARDAARAAVALNPGDGPSWLNLALLCEALGDGPCQLEATARAVETAEFSGIELVNAALIYERAGRPDDADDAYRRSLLTQRLTALATDWRRPVSIDDVEIAEDFGAHGQLNRLLAAWATDGSIDPAAVDDPAIRALAHAIRGERAAAEGALRDAVAVAPDALMTWEIHVVLSRHWGAPTDRALRIGEVVRGGPFPPEDRPTEEPRVSFDLAVFRSVPSDGFLPGVERLQTNPPYPWVLADVLPSSSTASGSR